MVFDLLQEAENHNIHEPSFLTIDLEDLNSISSKVQQALTLFGGVDIIINNAGISYRGCIQDTALSVDQKLMAVNFLGHVAVIKGMLFALILCLLCGGVLSHDSINMYHLYISFIALSFLFYFTTMPLFKI